ncbi:unnamed protein product [Paramecium octaurelia]|uniref:Uncharacterized protein n=1 Tax=Paramecium octaurelia TaxID=43137 RepID=A0A8S1WWT3_PAROT|nr:unnamed protein product [Paramecium octaurelia]
MTKTLHQQIHYKQFLKTPSYSNNRILHKIKKLLLIRLIHTFQKNWIKIIEGNKLLDIFSDSSYKAAYKSLPFKDFEQISRIEGHASVRNILKNKEIIEMQKELYSKDLANFSNKLKLDMQNKPKKLEQLESQVLIGDNKTLLKNQLQQAYEDYESYIDNITEMSQKWIQPHLLERNQQRSKCLIDQVIQNMKGIEDDLRRLCGKSYTELLQIRKDKVLQQKQEAENWIKFTFNFYLIVQSFNREKEENHFGDFKSHLISKQYNNYEGEVNEFVWSEREKSKDVILLKGKASSGKSRASRNIEEFLWINESTSPSWLPIFVSLPSLKNPKHNIIEQKSQNYNFGKIQIREFKQAVTYCYLNIIFILKNYDEMKIECIQSNLYQTNRLQLIQIFKYLEKMLKLLLQQQKFNIQDIKLGLSSEYLKQYCEVRKYYKFLKQIKGQNFSLKEFKLIWTILEDCINTITNSKYDQYMLFQPSDVEKIIQKFQTKKRELIKISSVINNVNINHLMGTPFMMEIIVYVLSKCHPHFQKQIF